VSTLQSPEGPTEQTTDSADDTFPATEDSVAGANGAVLATRTPAPTGAVPNGSGPNGVGPTAAAPITAQVVASARADVPTSLQSALNGSTPNESAAKPATPKGSAPDLGPAGPGANGTQLNGIPVNGASINGTQLNAALVDAALVDGAPVDGVVFNGTPVNGTALNGSTLDAPPLDGSAAPASTSINGSPAPASTPVDGSAAPAPMPVDGSAAPVIGALPSAPRARTGVPALAATSHAAPVVAGPAHRWGFGAFLLAEAVLLLSAVFLAAILDPGPPGGVVPVSTALIGTIVPTMLAAGVALLATVLRGNGPVIDLRLTVRRADLVVGLKLGGIGIVLTVVAAFIWTKAVGAKDASSAINGLFGSGKMSVTSAVILFVYVCLLGPICEELIFRGLLWGAIKRQNWGRWAAFVLSTAIFAVSHLEPSRTILLLVIAVPIGLARLFTDRLPASIVAHQVNNFLPALVTLLVALGIMSQ
jgi:hypothetical protein